MASSHYKSIGTSYTHVKPGLQYDDGTVSVASIVSVAGKNAFLNIQEFDYLIGWTLEMLHSCDAGVEIILFAASHRHSQHSVVPAS